MYSKAVGQDAAVVVSLFTVGYCAYGKSVATLRCLMRTASAISMQEHVSDPHFFGLHEDYSSNYMYKT